MVIAELNTSAAERALASSSFGLSATNDVEPTC
jgi:hypothetical protein